jgi:hypothetical protein
MFQKVKYYYIINYLLGSTIIAEWNYTYVHDAQGAHSASYEVNMNPSRVLAKVALNEYIEYVRGSTETPPYDGQYAVIRINSIRRKRNDGLIEQVNIGSNVVYDDRMTSITIFVYGNDTYFIGILQLEYWG